MRHRQERPLAARRLRRDGTRRSISASLAGKNGLLRYARNDDRLPRPRTDGTLSRMRPRDIRHCEERSDAAVHAAMRSLPPKHKVMDCHGLRPRNDGFGLVQSFLNWLDRAPCSCCSSWPLGGIEPIMDGAAVLALAAPSRGCGQGVVMPMPMPMPMRPTNRENTLSPAYPAPGSWAALGAAYRGSRG